MKVLLWLWIIVLIPFSASSQGRFYLRASISMPVSGSSDLQAYISHGSGAFDGSLEVKLRDTIALTAGDNRDSLRNTELKLGGGSPYLCLGTCTFQFDSLNHILHKIGISGQAIGGKGFFISVDSLPVVALSDSEWTLPDQSVPCNYSCYYDDKYLMPNGNNGEDIASGLGQSTFVGRNILGVRRASGPSTIHITSFGSGIIQIETSANLPSQEIEIFDGLGRQVFHTTFSGNTIRVSNLRSGCYITRLGSEMVKFVVI